MEGTIKLLERSLATLDLLEPGDNHRRPSRQRGAPEHAALSALGSCLRCKRAKQKCDGSLQTACSRCRRLEVACEFPGKQKPGRKRGLSERDNQLRQMRHDLLEVLERLHIFSGTPSSPHRLSALAPSPTTYRSITGTATPEGVGGSLEELDNPLAVLAHLSHLREGLAVASGRQYDHEDLTAADAWISSAQSYYESGLHEPSDDTNHSLDAVALGIITELDLKRLLHLYFNKLWPFIWHLDAAIHTVEFLRETSPLLLAAVASVAAMYDPHSSTVCEHLQRHAYDMQMRVISEGFKSVEIVQGFCIMAHWAIPAVSWKKDQSWSWVGLAHRMAAEIRMDRPLDTDTFLRYRGKTILSPGRFAEFRDCRLRSWRLLLCGYISMSAQTGRLRATGAAALMSTVPPPTPRPAPGDVFYNLGANEQLNCVVARWLSPDISTYSKRSQDARAFFRQCWSADLDVWRQEWPAINTFLTIRYHNVRGLFLGTLLRFPGPKTAIIDECIQEALRTLKHVNEWHDESILYASNFAVTSIAYSSVLLLRLVDFAAPDQLERNKSIREACAQIVLSLLRIAVTRVNSSSVASLQSARIQKLLNSLPPLPETRTAEAEVEDTTMDPALFQTEPISNGDFMRFIEGDDPLREDLAWDSLFGYSGF